MDNCACGKDSEIGCHGIRGQEVYDEYYCSTCYNKKDSKVKKVKEDVKDSICGGSPSQSDEIRTVEKVPDMVEHYYNFYKARLGSKSG